MIRGHRKPNKIRVRTIEVLWKTENKLVKEEMERLIEEEGRTCSKFQLRTAASKNILVNMTPSAVKKLEELRKNISKNGYSEEHKRT
jgi:hypothetical protein